MVEKEVAIARLQSTLLRLSKDDLIKLLKSTYQAMRIKHGIPFERADVRPSGVTSQRELRNKGAKTPAVTRKRKPSAGRKKLPDATPDTNSFRKVEQPTFRQVDRLADDLNDLHFSSLSYDSDDVHLSDPCAANEHCEVPPTHIGQSKGTGTPESILSDRDLAIQTLKDDVRQLVPMLDLSTIGPSAKEAYKLSELINVQHDRPNSNKMNATCIDMPETSGMASTENDNSRFAEAPGTYAYHMPLHQPFQQPKIVPATYTMAPRPGGWFPGHPNPQFVRGAPQMYPVQPMRPAINANIGYHDAQTFRNMGPIRLRSHSMQRL
ncbi:transcriptional regulator, putative [Babesia ovis]|uniref:Transcriptional regulator, putative n=1 Tax=Babesia ovis TaxID=5869 RepID=A0A9W5WUH5_BABOV|nr:transcriptional regulator, putative [Babesia ovis]